MPDGSARRNTTSVQSRIEKIERFLADKGISPGERQAARLALARLRARTPAAAPARGAARRFQIDHSGEVAWQRQFGSEMLTDDELYERFYAILRGETPR